MLSYASLQWTDEDVVKLCGAIATGKLVKLETLILFNNQIGDAGVAALAEAAGKLPQLNTLSLIGNQIGDAGVAALAEAAGKLVKLRSTSAATRLATPALPRSRRRRAS